ncbi:YfiR family protein [Oceanicoccus sagamiensis]|uniref:DUF4154 domain-containing protein n=1 Tax=Oceanicoccus sagamiensis TaxID=716816 RepID=A0A1X9NCP7_9GAMM|nr:YfiR family protein [Oceanicoccus sagamiensis]ARN75800.1 hypothetical protein BST96_17815 [Oceanicoccus sagamiensis]
MHKPSPLISRYLCLLVLMTAPALANEDIVSREYKIKAAYLYNLIKFVNWPESEALSQSTTNICVFGDNPFDGHLNKLSSRKAKGRDIQITYLQPQQDNAACHILFIPRSASAEIAKHDKTKPQLLTVGEDKQFLEEGGLISLVVANNNVQLQINLTKAKELGFEISGNLLEIAKVVK